MMKLLSRILITFNLFQTLTFHDDYFSGTTPDKWAEKSSKAIKLFKQRILRQFPQVGAVIRREWVPRLSGVLRGRPVPHFHVLWHLKGLSKDNYEETGKAIGRIWVECLALVDPEAQRKAQAVNTHYSSPGMPNNAFEKLNGQEHVTRYVSKYVAKVEEYPESIPVGRSWMQIGTLETHTGQEIEIPPQVMPTLSRLLRKAVRGKTRSSQRLRYGLKKKNCNTFIFINAATVLRLLEFVEEYHVPI